LENHSDHCCTPPAGDVHDGPFRRVLWTVLALNAIMFVVEAGAGLSARSVSLQADALDFLGDSASYAISLFVLARGIRWRTGAALLKGAAMGLFGLWVIGATAWRLVIGGVPNPIVMSRVGLLALAVNIFCAVLLYRFRGGDANMRSVWLCSRRRPQQYRRGGGGIGGFCQRHRLARSDGGRRHVLAGALCIFPGVASRVCRMARDIA
jgi:Co/Zn/Cd efflux system component